MLHHAKFHGNSPKNIKVTVDYTLGTINIPLILFSMFSIFSIFYLNSYKSIYFSRRARDVGEFDFCSATHQTLEQSFSHSRELVSLCNNNLHVIWNKESIKLMVIFSSCSPMQKWPAFFRNFQSSVDCSMERSIKYHLF